MALMLFFIQRSIDIGETLVEIIRTKISALKNNLLPLRLALYTLIAGFIYGVYYSAQVFAIIDPTKYSITGKTSQQIFMEIFLNNAMIVAFIVLGGTLVGAILLIGYTQWLSVAGPFGFLALSGGVVFGATFGYFLNSADIITTLVVFAPVLIFEFVALL